MSSPTSVPVLAAGAVCWRRRGDRVEVLVISRPKYRDTSLPKGKVDDGESVPEAAVREIREETGFAVTLGPPLGTTEYTLPSGRDKVVYYWAAEVPQAELERGRFTPTDEVDRLEWMSVPRARRELSYERDKEVLARFAAIATRDGIQSFALIVLRHAKAAFDSKSGRDADRKLLPRGEEQAAQVVPVLLTFGPRRVLSSPAARCVATVAPLAKALGVKVKEHAAISQDGWEASGHDPRTLRKLVARRLEKGLSTVLCSHAPVLPEILEQVAELTESPNGGRITRAGILGTAEFTVVHLAAAEPHHILGVETHSAGH